ncbi:MAG: RodZ domain-containing protein [Cyanobacteria bacterium P01_H01_bin.15]
MNGKASPPSADDLQTTLTELGAQLREARVAQALTLDTIAQRTAIQRRLLQAIEVGDLEALPEPVYVRSLLTQYAQALHLESSEYAERFFPPTPASKNRSWAPLSGLQPRAWHLYILYVLLLVFSIRGLSNWLTQQRPQIVIMKPSAEENIPSLSSINSKVLDPSELNSPVTVVVDIQSSSWLQVETDDAIAFEGTVAKGTQKTWKARQKITVRAEDAGAVFVTVNNQARQRFGQSGKPKQMTYAAGNP